MKRKILASLVMTVFVAFAFIIGCGRGGRAADMDQTPPQGSPTSRLLQDIAVRETEKDLSPAALETYAYLLFIQSILDEDEAALLDALPMLKNADVPQSIWLDGGVWLMSRKSPNAVIYLEKALSVMPDDISINLLYAEALGDHGMANRGIEAMNKFLAAHPDELDARLELALLLVKDRQFDEAQKILSSITAKERTYLVDYYQAKALIGMGKRGEAIPYLKKAVKGMPDFIEALAELAFAYEQEGNLKEARATYEKLQKLNFSAQDIALKLISLSLKLQQPEKAVQYVNKGPDSLPFKLTAANMLLEARHYLQAETILKQIAKKDDAPVEVYLLLADLVYEQRRNLAMALEWLDKVPHTNNALEKVCVLRAQLQAEAGKLAQAQETITKGLKEFPNSPELHDLDIRMLAREKKLPQALQKALEATRKWPSNTGLSFLYASLLDESGKKKEALNIMEDIIKKQPDNFQALNYIGFTLAEENRDLDRALELLKRADELSPNQAYIVDSLAWALFRSGKGEDALQQIRRAISLGNGVDAAIWEHYGDIAREQGHKDEARKAYRKAIELKPDNVKTLRERLSRI